MGIKNTNIGITINTDKTKIIKINEGNNQHNLRFTCQGKSLRLDTTNNCGTIIMEEWTLCAWLSISQSVSQTCITTWYTHTHTFFHFYYSQTFLGYTKNIYFRNNKFQLKYNWKWKLYTNAYNIYIFLTFTLMWNESHFLYITNSCGDSLIICIICKLCYILYVTRDIQTTVSFM